MQEHSKADVQSGRDLPDTQSETTRRERRDAAEHRRRILEAARALFATQGVDTTSMYEIARSAGVGQGTLYRRYAHKGELCGALLHEACTASAQISRHALQATPCRRWPGSSLSSTA